MRDDLERRVVEAVAGIEEIAATVEEDLAAIAEHLDRIGTVLELMLATATLSESNNKEETP